MSKGTPMTPERILAYCVDCGRKFVPENFEQVRCLKCWTAKEARDFRLSYRERHGISKAEWRAACQSHEVRYGMREAKMVGSWK